MNAYVVNLLNAVQGKPSEPFADAEKMLNPTASSGSTAASTAAMPAASYGLAIVSFILFSLIPFMLFCYGSAKLSWCLNKSYGWSILCFFFPGFYYPYYSLFLNPLCNTPMVGGKRR